MRRLIDEETLKKSIGKWLNPDPSADRMVDIDDIAVSVMMEIEEQPTAYDVDKVVAELEKLADKANDKILEAGELQLYYDGYEDALRTAVEVVKGGGVDA